MSKKVWSREKGLRERFARYGQNLGKLTDLEIELNEIANGQSHDLKHPVHELLRVVTGQIHELETQDRTADTKKPAKQYEVVASF